MTQTRTPHMTDYEAERRNFHLEVPEYFNFATDVIGKWASDPNKLAMLWIGQYGEEEPITFAHFSERLGAIPIPCTTLLTPKDIQFRAEIAEPVAFITDNEGVVKFDQVRNVCPTVKVTVVAKHGAGTARLEGWTDFRQVVVEASPEFTGPKTRSDDPCLVYFTSGTVGYPKMVLHTHASYPIGHTITGKYWLDLHEDDLHWNLSEMGWANCQN